MARPQQFYSTEPESFLDASDRTGADRGGLAGCAALAGLYSSARESFLDVSDRTSPIYEQLAGLADMSDGCPVGQQQYYQNGVSVCQAPAPFDPNAGLCPAGKIATYSGGILICQDPPSLGANAPPSYTSPNRPGFGSQGYQLNPAYRTRFEIAGGGPAPAPPKFAYAAGKSPCASYVDQFGVTIYPCARPGQGNTAADPSFCPPGTNLDPLTKSCLPGGGASGATGGGQVQAQLAAQPKSLAMPLLLGGAALAALYYWVLK